MAPPRTREEKLFGAACLKLTLESRVPSSTAGTSEIYRGALADLGLTEDEVDSYLRTHRSEVEARLAAGAGQRGRSR